MDLRALMSRRKDQVYPGTGLPNPEPEGQFSSARHLRKEQP